MKGYILALRTMTKQSWKSRRRKAAGMVGSASIMPLTTFLTVCSAFGHDEL